jgi:selenoprotein W-related protein
LRPGGGGVFDVVVDGELVFSKHHTGRFPEEWEILDALEERAPKGD